MIGDGTVMMVEAKTNAAAATDGSVSTFDAHPLLLSASGSPSIGKNPETIEICNTTPKIVCPGDRMPVAKTIQGNFVTVSMQVGRAMCAIFSKNGSGWDVVDYWQGEDPEVCGPPIVQCKFDCSCLKDGDEVYATYSPEDDKYFAVSSDSAMLGKPTEVEVMVDDLNAFRWSTGNCGELEYATRKIRTFDSCDTEDAGETKHKYISWSGAITPVVVGASIQVNGQGKPCLAFTRAYALVCASGQGVAEPLMLCGTECCDKSVHYKRFTSPNAVPPEATEVGEYDFDAEGSPLTDTVAEQCFVVGEAPEGWSAGSGELLGEGFTRSHPSPECCPPEEPPA